MSDRDPARVRPLLDAPRFGEVIAVADPQGLGRVRVRVEGADADGQTPLWAPVAVPFAGRDRGAFLLPDVGDTVLVAFVAGDPVFPVVLGGVWTGDQQPPETVSGSIDRWTFTGKAGTRIAILEDAAGSERVEIETPAGTKAVITDQGGGKVTVTAGGATLEMTSSGITVQTGSRVSIEGSSVSISASMMNVDCPLVTFSGVINCQTLISSSVVSSSYTPGAGNVW